MAIFYLDIDDEITSAAARIRGTGDLVVVLVLPSGSRIATSRINFRLLAREAQQRSRRLSIVTPDASARALAATAGLPVYASTLEYESSFDEPAGVAEQLAGPPVIPIAGAAGAAAQPSAPAPDAGLSVAQARRLTPDELAAREAALAGGVGGGPAGPSARSTESSRDGEHGARHAAVPEPHAAPARLDPSTGLASERGPLEPSRPRRRHRTALIVAVLLVAFLGVAGSVAAYLLLPTASIVLTVRPAPLAPVEFVATADPAATATDPAAAVVPAMRLQIPLAASGTFAATGKRIDEAPAVGSVTWTNCDPTRSYSLPKGTLVRTLAGVAFGTDETVFLPVAILNPPKIACQDRVVSVTAAKTGTAGNVPAGTITVIPGQYNSVVISVRNPAPTSGGIRNEFPKVTQKDVTAALAALGKQLDAQLAAGAAAPPALPAGSTAFPETATRDATTPTLDTTTLVDQEVAQFDLGATSTGTVVTVDQAPILALGAARLAAAVPAGSDMVAGSAQVTVGSGTVDGQRVHFGVTASGESVPRVDESALRTQIRGRSPADARAILAAYGDATVTLWPGWATMIPTLDARVDLRVERLAGTSSSPAPSPTASTAP